MIREEGTISSYKKDDGARGSSLLTGVLLQGLMGEEDTTSSSSSNSSAVWLIVGHSPPKKDMTNNNKKKMMKQSEWWCPGQSCVALACSKDERDEYIRQHADTTLKDGYTLQAARTIEQLRDHLCAILPPSSTKEENDTDDNYKDDCSNGISEEERIRFELFRSVIKHEDDLLNQRVSWIILAQSFLMAAFITSSSHIMFRYVTATVGMLTLLVTMPAIVAAGQNIELQQQIYFQRIPSDQRCQQLHGHPRNPNKNNKKNNHNANESILRKRHGHLLPTMSFRGKWGIPILKTVIAIATVQLLGWICLVILLLVY
jgi:hypothetical protein